MPDLVDRICGSYKKEGLFEEKRCRKLPSKAIIIEITEDLFKIIFPGFYGRRDLEESTIQYYVGDILDSIYSRLVEEVERALCYWCPAETASDQCSTCDCLNSAKKIVSDFMKKLPRIREALGGDVQAAFDGDPAAKSLEEIIVSYPGLYAIATHRLAHELYLEKVPLISRIMSEHAHGKTGIDIHPGAKIGQNFFTDHGTGIVIGETTEIGNNVKIYQGVTLGALSFPKDERGNIIKGKKRHPTIEDNVTIYAGATILGGDTVIGKNSVIGGNVWLTSSVEPGTKVLATPQ
ncbi:MAG: serine acetyltransferase, partial [Candidatus Aureabacteria bacterium]|nr:serine acetyltransferase [Candidatus Auribacterota bacterium]